MSNLENNINDKQKLLQKLSKEQYDDEYFIEKAIYTEKVQQSKTYTFFKDNTKNDIQKYCWCQRPCDINMSLHRFVKNGTIEAFMSESLAKERGLIQIDLNEFMWKFVKPLIEENIEIKKEIKQEKEKNKYLGDREEYLERRRTEIINVFQNEVTETTIPKNKIKEKIEELENKKENVKGLQGLRYSETGYIQSKINTLEELLEE